MRILIVSKSLPYMHKGGIQNHVWELSDHLARRGHSISILTSGDSKNHIREGRVNGRHIIELPFYPYPHIPVVSTAGVDWAFNQSATKWILINQHRFDVIHLQGRSGVAVLREKKRLHVPVVSTLHGFLADEYSFESEIYEHRKDVKLHRKMAFDMETLALEKSDYVITVSKFLFDSAAQRIQSFRNCACIIPNGIEISPRPSTLNFTINRLLYVGQVERIKGVFQLLEALKLTKTDIGLTVAGNGRERMALESHICKLELDNRVQTVGRLEASEITEMIDSTYALILPSYLETQGHVLMQANVRCKPVLASNIPGINELVSHGQNGLLFPAGDASAMASSIDYLFSDIRLAQSLGAGGRERMEKEYSWESIAIKTEEVYNCLRRKQNFIFSNQVNKKSTARR